MKIMAVGPICLSMIGANPSSSIALEDLPFESLMCFHQCAFTNKR